VKARKSGIRSWFVLRRWSRGDEKNEQAERVVDGRSDAAVPLRSERGFEAYLTPFTPELR